jgi:CRP-like cAMP-binding protein
MLSIVNVPAGRRLMAEGEQGAEMFVVLEGELRGSVTREGREIELARMRRGDSVGEIGLFAGRRTADVDAVGEVRLLQMNAPELERLRRRYPRIASRVFHNLNEILAERLVRTTRKVR